MEKNEKRIRIGRIGFWVSAMPLLGLAIVSAFPYSGRAWLIERSVFSIIGPVGVVLCFVGLARDKVRTDAAVGLIVGIASCLVFTWPMILELME